MLGYLILVILQIAVGLFGAPFLLSYLPSGVGGLPLLLLKGAIIGGLIFLTGLVFSFILKGVRTPFSSTAGTSIVGGLLGAAAVIAIDSFNVAMPPGVTNEMLLIAGGILGYLVRR
ncbi:MAG: hypothetical protein AAGG72_06625 [Pseudomonadota bacterium]